MQSYRGVKAVVESAFHTLFGLSTREPAQPESGPRAEGLWLPFFASTLIPPHTCAGFAAQSLLAALGSVQFVSNVFFASFVLKEKVWG